MVLRQVGRRMATSLIAAVLLVQLGGCFPVIVAGVAAGGYSATDRRSVGAQADDKVIGIKADHRISDYLEGRAHVNVSVFNRKILLTGEVPDDAAKRRAEEVVASIENVTGVVNELTIGPAESIGARSQDAFITTDVKTHLVSSHDIFANALKVETEGGQVFMMGLVTQAEGDRAAEIARSVNGVSRVVKVFDYITDAQLREIQGDGPPPAAPAPVDTPVATPATPS